MEEVQRPGYRRVGLYELPRETLRRIVDYQRVESVIACPFLSAQPCGGEHERESRHGKRFIELDGMARDALAKVGLTGWEHHDPGELSGGQQQRVAIARAIVTKPDVLLADEPTGNLDTARSHEIMELLTGLNRDDGITVIMVTHELDMAEYASRIVHFVDGKVQSDTTRKKVAR